MTIEQRIEAAEKLLAEAKAELAKTTTRKNWPEKMEAGMVFRHKRGKVCILTKANDLVWLSAPDDDAVHGGTYGPAKQGFGGKEDCFTYLGHARDILTIRTDAHEPTGAELVGKVCEFSDGNRWSAPCECTSEPKYRAANGLMWKYARLAR